MRNEFNVNRPVPIRFFNITEFQYFEYLSEKNCKKRHENVFQFKKPSTFAAALRAKFIEGDVWRRRQSGSRVIYSRFRAADSEAPEAG